MHFGPILTNLDLFIGRVPAKISLIHLLKSEEKKNAEMKITNVKFG